MYESLTDYLEILREDNIGEWMKQDEDAPPNKFIFPHMVYSDVVWNFVYEVYATANRIDMPPHHKVLEKNGIKNVEKVNISELDGECTFVILCLAVSEDRFSEGLLYRLIKEGFIQKLLRHLKELDK